MKTTTTNAREKEEEQWIPIRFFEDNYSVSNFGRIKSNGRNTTSGGIIKPVTTANGYRRVCLYNDGNKYHKLVHRLVLGSFSQRPSWSTQVNHIDGNKTNNRLYNLEWSDNSHNQKHALKNGLSKLPWQKITDRDKKIIRKLMKIGGGKILTQTIIGEVFGVTQSNISLICLSKGLGEL